MTSFITTYPRKSTIFCKTVLAIYLNTYFYIHLDCSVLRTVSFRFQVVRKKTTQIFFEAMWRHVLIAGDTDSHERPGQNYEIKGEPWVRLVI